MSDLKRWRLMPPRPELCPVCATSHPAEGPHDRESLYYQMAFQQQHGRWPTWEDALAHCDPERQALWREELAAVLGEQER